MIDEIAFAGHEHLDAEFVAGFDRKQGYPDAGPDLAAFEAHGLGPRSRIVEFGAGTGQFTVPAARRFGRVTAVEIAPAMLAALRERTSVLGNVSCERAGFLSYSHEGEPADGVYTRHALHQLPDFWKAVALDRIGRMLRPGGVLRIRDLIYDFTPDEAGTVFGDWLRNAHDDPATGYTAGDYAEHIRTEHSTFRWLFEPMLAMAGFEIADVRYEGRLYGAYTCVRR